MATDWPEPFPGPAPSNEDWIDFLRWLATDRLFNGNEIVDVVEKPWHWSDHYEQYLAEGGADR